MRALLQSSDLHPGSGEVMNTQDDWKTVAIIQNPERLEFWKKVLGGNRAPIKSIFTTRVRVPEKGVTDAFMLDLQAITAEQRERLIQAIAERFNIPIDEVAKEIDQGVPILAEDVSVSTTEPGLMFSIIDDIDDSELDDYDPHDEEWDDEEYDYEDDL